MDHKPQYRMLVGEAVDGTAVYAPTQTPCCENCNGKGRYWMEQSYWGARPGEWIECECCHGSGNAPEERYELEPDDE